MIEEIANKFESAITKGFINILILSILEKTPTHGYKIKKEIEERTLGIWVPPDSSMYTSLKKMTEDGLVKFKEESEGERVRKVYKLTLKGKSILRILLKRHKRIKRALDSLISSVLSKDEFKDLVFTFNNTQYFLPTNFAFDNQSKDMEKIDKINYLEYQKKQYFSAIGLLKNIIKNIDTTLLKIKKNNDEI
ncbi:MAG: helix-turn-helix transcriptional regulator [Candidatus Lokiarchaeota archaeon]|nr:helix-turn-helix transcriptional regulator [Candidatus Lokiarchaeota archaeon]